MKILFQGDSITDAGRDRANYHDMGRGYPKYAARKISEMYPDVDFEFIDLGIGGHQTKDLLARLDSDFIDICPDIVSILIGINDVWHHAQNRDWIPGELFESNYRTILTAIKEKTNAKIMILEPFLLPAPDKEFFRVDLDPKIQIVRSLAREFADEFIPLDGILAEAYTNRPYTDFSPDGVHPSPLGAEFIGGEYAKRAKKIIDLLLAK